MTSVFGLMEHTFLKAKSAQSGHKGEHFEWSCRMCLVVLERVFIKSAGERLFVTQKKNNGDVEQTLRDDTSYFFVVIHTLGASLSALFRKFRSISGRKRVFFFYAFELFNQQKILSPSERSIKHQILSVEKRPNCVKFK